MKSLHRIEENGDDSGYDWLILPLPGFRTRSLLHAPGSFIRLVSHDKPPDTSIFSHLGRLTWKIAVFSPLEFHDPRIAYIGLFLPGQASLLTSLFY
jgi:hypothetical protein